MATIITFLFDKIYKPLITVMRANVFLSWTIILAVIGGVIGLYKNIKN